MKEKILQRKIDVADADLFIDLQEYIRMVPWSLQDVDLSAGKWKLDVSSTWGLDTCVQRINVLKVFQLVDD